MSNYVPLRYEDAREWVRRTYGPGAVVRMSHELRDESQAPLAPEEPEPKYPGIYEVTSRNRAKLLAVCLWSQVGEDVSLCWMSAIDQRRLKWWDFCALYAVVDIEPVRVARAGQVADSRAATEG